MYSSLLFCVVLATTYISSFPFVQCWTTQTPTTYTTHARKVPIITTSTSWTTTTKVSTTNVQQHRSEFHQLRSSLIADENGGSRDLMSPLDSENQVMTTPQQQRTTKYTNRLAILGLLSMSLFIATTTPTTTGTTWGIAHDALPHQLATIDAAATMLQQYMTSITSNIWEHYTHVLEVHPIATKASTSGFVYTLGDIIAQRTEQQSAIAAAMAFGDDEIGGEETPTTRISLDMARVARSAIAGFVGHGPMSHMWYNVCDHFFTETLHCTEWWSVLPKVVVDQTVWGPIWNNSYLLLLGLMKREQLDVIWNDIRRSTIPLVVSGLKLWPAAHLLTYGVIPIEHRLLWVDFVEIFWVTILATQAANLHPTTTTTMPPPLLTNDDEANGALVVSCANHDSDNKAVECS